MVRRGAGQPQGLRPDLGQDPLRRRSAPRTRRSTTRSRSGRRRRATAATDAATCAWTTPSGSRPGPRSRARPRRRGRAENEGRVSAQPAPVPDEGPASHRPLAGLFWRVRGPAGRLAAGRAARVAGSRLPRLPRRPADHRVLDAERLHRPDRQGVQPRQLQADLRGAGLPQDRAADGVARGARHRHRHPAGVPDRVLHGARRGHPDEGPARRRGADAAVGELPREGLLVAHDAVDERRHQLVPRSARAARADVRLHPRLDRHGVPVAAVHDPAALRRPGADQRLAAGRVRRPRRVAHGERSAASSCRSRCPRSSRGRSSPSR